MTIVVDPGSPTPPYEQVRVQIAAMVGRGELPFGSRLPTVRRLAADLGLAPNTVARAYRELERAGVLETRGRHGTFVAMGSDAAADAAATQAALYASRIRELGIAPAEAVRLVARALGVTTP